MTISEQLRDSALCDLFPFTTMSWPAFDACLDFQDNSDGAIIFSMKPDNLKTFMLLVAEALE